MKKTNHVSSLFAIMLTCALLLGISMALPSYSLAAYTTVMCRYGETGTCKLAASCSAADIQSAIDASSSGGYGTMNSNGTPRTDGTFDG
ncbi:MAG: hypothetical protein LBQ00_03940, partial [Syntrophobacterales bacterium]|nr:hypothetical protein [Syntrophobacterales bacterium]